MQRNGFWGSGVATAFILQQSSSACITWIDDRDMLVTFEEIRGCDETVIRVMLQPLEAGDAVEVRMRHSKMLG
jgi:hypothetical protein